MWAARKVFDGLCHLRPLHVLVVVYHHDAAGEQALGAALEVAEDDRFGVTAIDVDEAEAIRLRHLADRC